MRRSQEEKDEFFENSVKMMLDLGVDEELARELLTEARNRGRAMGRIQTPTEDQNDYDL